MYARTPEISYKEKTMIKFLKTSAIISLSLNGIGTFVWIYLSVLLQNKNYMDLVAYHSIGTFVSGFVLFLIYNADNPNW